MFGGFAKQTFRTLQCIENARSVRMAVPVEQVAGSEQAEPDGARVFEQIAFGLKGRSID